MARFRLVHCLRGSRPEDRAYVHLISRDGKETEWKHEGRKSLGRDGEQVELDLTDPTKPFIVIRGRRDRKKERFELPSGDSFISPRGVVATAHYDSLEELLFSAGIIPTKRCFEVSDQAPRWVHGQFMTKGERLVGRTVDPAGKWAFVRFKGGLGYFGGVRITRVWIHSEYRTGWEHSFGDALARHVYGPEADQEFLRCWRRSHSDHEAIAWALKRYEFKAAPEQGNAFLVRRKKEHRRPGDTDEFKLFILQPRTGRDFGRRGREPEEFPVLRRLVPMGLFWRVCEELKLDYKSRQKRWHAACSRAGHEASEFLSEFYETRIVVWGDRRRIMYREKGAGEDRWRFLDVVLGAKEDPFSSEMTGVVADVDPVHSPLDHSFAAVAACSVEAAEPYTGVEAIDYERGFPRGDGLRFGVGVRLMMGPKYEGGEKVRASTCEVLGNWEKDGDEWIVATRPDLLVHSAVLSVKEERTKPPEFGDIERQRWQPLRDGSQAYIAEIQRGHYLANDRLGVALFVPRGQGRHFVFSIVARKETFVIGVMVRRSADGKSITMEPFDNGMLYRVQEIGYPEPEWTATHPAIGTEFVPFREELPKK